MSWRRRCGDAANQVLAKTRTNNTTASPVESPIMANRPFQISAWGVNPRFQALSSSAPTSSGSLAEALTDSAMTLDLKEGLDSSSIARVAAVFRRPRLRKQQLQKKVSENNGLRKQHWSCRIELQHPSEASEPRRPSEGRFPSHRNANASEQQHQSSRHCPCSTPGERSKPESLS